MPSDLPSAIRRRQPTPSCNLATDRAKRDPLTQPFERTKPGWQNCPQLACQLIVGPCRKKTHGRKEICRYRDYTIHYGSPLVGHLFIGTPRYWNNRTHQPKGREPNRNGSNRPKPSDSSHGVKKICQAKRDRGPVGVGGPSRHWPWGTWLHARHADVFCGRQSEKSEKRINTSTSPVLCLFVMHHPSIRLLVVQ